MKTQKYCIFTENITGMTHIISGILSDANIDILAMEVVPEKVYIKLHEPDKKRLKILMSQFDSHPNILKVESISYLPIEIHQKSELQLGQRKVQKQHEGLQYLLIQQVRGLILQLLPD